MLAGLPVRAYGWSPTWKKAPLKLFQTKPRPLPPLGRRSPPPAVRHSRGINAQSQTGSEAAGSAAPPSFATAGTGRDTARSGRWGGAGSGALSRGPAERSQRGLSAVEVVGVTCLPSAPSRSGPRPACPSHVLRPRPACWRRFPPQLQHLGPGRPHEGLAAGGSPRPGARVFLARELP